MPRIGRSIETESGLAVARGQRKGEGGVTPYGVLGFLFDDENVLELDRGDGCPTL